MPCPKPGCPEGKDYGNTVSRHVWAHHARWARDTGYPPLRRKCDLCKRTFARPDLLKRHKDNNSCGVRLVAEPLTTDINIELEGRHLM